MKTKVMEILAAAIVVFAAGAANAISIINFEERVVGGTPTVIATGSGSANLAGLTFDSSGNRAAVVGAQYGLAVVGSALNDDVMYWTGISGPASFGTGDAFPATGVGDKFGVFGLFGVITLQDGYASGDPLSAVSEWGGETFATLGLTPGTYTWTWGSGGDADSLTVNIEAVPEANSLVMLGLGSLSLLLGRKRRA